MDRVQQNGGTAGLVAGALLAVLFVLSFGIGQDAMALGDPVRSLAAVTAKWNLWVLASLLGLLAPALAILFVAGLAARLHDVAPTRARAIMYLALIGLAGYALGSLLGWVGGRLVVEHAARDQAAATMAWFTLGAVHTTLSMLGNVFTGTAAVIAGWAILETKAMSSSLGWFGVIYGAVSVLTLFLPAAMIVGLLGFLMGIIWLLWAGSALRREKAPA